jgi:hypothetical protein
MYFCDTVIGYRESFVIRLLGKYELFKKVLHHVVSYFYVILGYRYSMSSEVLQAVSLPEGETASSDR